MNKDERRISKKQQCEMYNVDRSTVENWVKERGLH